MDNGFETDDMAGTLQSIRRLWGLSQSELSKLLGSSLVSVARWERGDNLPSVDTAKKIMRLFEDARSGKAPDNSAVRSNQVFASHGARGPAKFLPLLDQAHNVKANLSVDRQAPLLDRLTCGPFWEDGQTTLTKILSDRAADAPTLREPAQGGISAGKNTYTYDAHTYHTKVPPQGIAEVLKQYLPEGGVILDPFAGSGMTGVAARTLGYDVVLNELSPAASFIADRFTSRIETDLFDAGIAALGDAMASLRATLYTTDCRECGKAAEIRYTVWSYKVKCPTCAGEFVLWDHCRSYGRTVRDHKILSEFYCPCCDIKLKKSRLTRTSHVPVLVGYKCCTNLQVEHPPSEQDMIVIENIERNHPSLEADFLRFILPEGMNLSQPKRHGLTSIDRFYTPRNLAAMSHLWRSIHHFPDVQLSGFLGFVFTSLYQRVTRLSEYRFWGGSGNTANFNVPYIFNEANVFLTFERKARTIRDHLETTAKRYSGRCVVHTGSATDLDFLPNASIDLIFTDPPFGGNINYSEMNIIWEAWLGAFTDNTDEAIVNKFQGKDASKYGTLIQKSLEECYRVLRQGSWLLLVFMNSSEVIWGQLNRAINGAGFSIERIDIFDKQHGTFKQFVSDNTAGSDLILHCRKAIGVDSETNIQVHETTLKAVERFMQDRRVDLPTTPFLHVRRDIEVDFRLLYSEWLAGGRLAQGQVCDFASFRKLVSSYIEQNCPN
jgi:DNA modification methylase/DNA-binding XRE family transcriptional regulator